MFASPQAMHDWIKGHGSYTATSEPVKLTRFRILLHSIADGDFNPAHCQPKFAKHSIFKGMISHGIGTLSRAEGPFLELFQFERPVETIVTAITAVYTKPLRRGDTYRYTFTVRSLRQSKLGWHARVRVVCNAAPAGQPERTVAVWNWRPVFIEKPNVPEKELSILRMRDYRSNLIAAIVPRPIRFGAFWMAYVGGLAIVFSGPVMLVLSVLGICHWGIDLTGTCAP
jgi:acyl dehydratase